MSAPETGGEAAENAEKRALEFHNEGTKLVKAWEPFGNSKKVKAIEMFEKSAVQYKLCNEYEDAAKAYLKCGELTEKFVKDPFTACNYYVEAAKAYKLFDVKEAIATYKLALIGLMEGNKFQQAAKCWRDIAILEDERKEFKACIAAYDKAADCYFAEDSNATGNEMLLKCAAVCADQEDYKKAIEYYERVAESSKGLGVFAVTEHYYKASLLSLVLGSKEGNTAFVRDKLKKYAKANQKYDGSKEFRFIENMTTAVEKDDVKKFTKVVFDYDKIYNLNDWISKLLLEVKRTLQKEAVQINLKHEEEEDEEDEEDLKEEKKHDEKKETANTTATAPTMATLPTTTDTTTTTATTASDKPKTVLVEDEDGPTDAPFKAEVIDLM